MSEQLHEVPVLFISQMGKLTCCKTSNKNKIKPFRINSTQHVYSQILPLYQLCTNNVMDVVFHVEFHL